MRVLQISPTLVGEGILVGQPCILIRLAGCNLHCTWCDTPEAHRGGSEVPFADIVDRGILAKSEWILLTGGEPLLQKSTNKLVKKWLEGGKKVLIETNGSVPIEKFLLDGVRISMDVKTPSSGEVNSHHKENLDLLRPIDAITFIIGDKKDYNWAKRFIKKHNMDAIIYFQPCWGRTSARRLAEWIISDGLNARLSFQLHKVLKIP